MNKRNVLLFVIGSMILLGGQFWLTSRYAKPLPRVESQQPAPAPTVADAPTAAPKPAVARAAAQGEAKTADPAATHTLASQELSLTWQVATGALKQVTWRQDGTPFFPETFAGLGALKGAGFETVREEQAATGTFVIFENAAQDRLSYFVPTRGHSLKVEVVSPHATALQLIANPATDEPVKHLGREIGRASCRERV